jgi:hypothetical protein
MTDFARIRDGVVRPISIDEAMRLSSDHLSHLLVVSENGESELAPGAVGLLTPCSLCALKESHIMVLRTLSRNSTAVIVIDISSCRHKTCVRFFVTTVGAPPDSGCVWMVDGVVDVLRERIP